MPKIEITLVLELEHEVDEVDKDVYARDMAAHLLDKHGTEKRWNDGAVRSVRTRGHHWRSTRYVEVEDDREWAVTPEEIEEFDRRDEEDDDYW